ncbi:MAG: hypothetical protein J6P40_07420 [Oscillospiraceae bacterium]|nr:hypothetical protein [Oscillospiraceae bacterium]
MTLEQLEIELIKTPKTAENRAKRTVLIRQVVKLLRENGGDKDNGEG